MSVSNVKVIIALERNSCINSSLLLPIDNNLAAWVAYIMMQLVILQE